MAYSTSVVTTSQPAARHVREVHNKIIYLDPDEALFQMFLRDLAKESTPNFKFEWYHRGDLYRNTTINHGAGYNTTDTSIVVTDGTQFRPSDLVFVPRTREVFHITSISTNTLTVTRGWANTGTIGTGVAMVDTDPLWAIGTSVGENSTIGSPRTMEPDNVYNYTMIMQTSLTISGTEMEMIEYGGPKWKNMEYEAGRQHIQEIDSALWWSGRQAIAHPVTGHPMRATNGLASFIGTSTGNYWNVAGSITKATWDQYLGENMFLYGNQKKMLFGNTRLINYIHQLAEPYEMTTFENSVFGWKFSQYRFHGGLLTLIPYRPFTKKYSSSGMGFIVDFDTLKYVYMKNRDTKYWYIKPGEDSTLTDGAQSQFITEFGLKCLEPLANGLVVGATGVA